MLYSIGRAAIRRVGARQSSVRVGEWTWHAKRLSIAPSPYEATKIQSGHEPWFAHSLLRSYATASKTTTKLAAKKATKGKPATSKRSSGTSKKATTKPKAKPNKVKAKQVKKVLTEAQKAKRADVKAKAELKALKATALLSTPKQLPASAWAVLVSEEMKEKKSKIGESFPGATTVMADAAARYKNLDPTEREHFNHIANQNKLTNEAAFRAWVESHTPEQIRVANAARLRLKHKLGKAGSDRFSPIEDPRIPKRARNARAVFTTERWASGDLNGISFVEASKTLHDEWNALSAAEKKHFEDVAAVEKTRYLQEYKTVFHRDPPSHNKTAAAV